MEGESTRVSSARGPSSPDLAPLVLVAENDGPLREFVREVLHLDRFRVLVAPNGQAALALAARWVPDLLVTDVAMPGLDGVGLIRAVRRLHPNVPTILTSASSSYRGRPLTAVAAELGVGATLIKPFDLVDFQLAVRTAVRPHTAFRLRNPTDVEVRSDAGSSCAPGRPGVAAS